MLQVNYKFNSGKVRNYCIKMNFYTNGTINEYNEMFERFCDQWTRAEYLELNVQRLAQNIFEHSSRAEMERLADTHGLNCLGELLEVIASDILYECSELSSIFVNR